MSDRKVAHFTGVREARCKAMAKGPWTVCRHAGKLGENLVHMCI